MLRSLLAATLAVPVLAAPAWAASTLEVTWPPPAYDTTSDSIFVIGTAPASQPVTINGKAVERSPSGNFGPSFALQMGDNTFVVRAGSQTLTLHVTRKPTEAPPPRGASFAAGSLAPQQDLARQPAEPITLSAVAPAGAEVSVKLGQRTIPLTPTPGYELPDNKAALTQKNAPQPVVAATHYEATLLLTAPGRYGHPSYTVTYGGHRSTLEAPGALSIMDPRRFEVAEVTADEAVARTGPSTDFSRLTPLPWGVRARVTGREGSWLRLDYGGWVNAKEAHVAEAPMPPHSIIRSIGAKHIGPWTDVAFPLQAPVPVSVTEGDGTFTLSLYGATAQTDIIRLDRDPLVDWLGWTQATPDRIDYTFHLKQPHPWGYKLAYQGTTLHLSLRQPPPLPGFGQSPLHGLRILIDPGHGGPDDPGTTGPDGTHEKDLTLAVGKLVRDRLAAMGADVVISRETDASVGLKERQDLIARSEPVLSVSLHYNALPDNGDVLHTQGVGAFWYNAQSEPLAAFMQRYLVEKLGRPSYGLFWDNLALTRPTVAPAVLIELAFLSNPYESEWARDPAQQQRLAGAIADGLAAYVQASTRDVESAR